MHIVFFLKQKPDTILSDASTMNDAINLSDVTMMNDTSSTISDTINMSDASTMNDAINMSDASKAARKLGHLDPKHTCVLVCDLQVFNLD